MKLFQLITCFFLCSITSYGADTTTITRFIKSIAYNNVKVDVVIQRSQVRDADVLLLFHGTVMNDKNSVAAAFNTIDRFQEILYRKDMLMVSVAYPEENMLLGDNIKQAEAALLWVKYKAANELGVSVKKIFLAGHSQGAYLVTRLNTMHETSGVVANAPGPLNLVYRCGLEESGKIQSGVFCTNLRKEYGSTDSDPNDYMKRSLLNFTSGFKSDILFVQGLDDSPIQMHTWPLFKKQVTDCSDCKKVEFVEVQGGKHTALFGSYIAQKAFNDFINKR